MDIPPYASSNAISREQYALVRKVELASASNIADGYILAELDVLKRRLATGFSISNKQCKETLLLLLYCVKSISPANAHSIDCSFAFAHAVNLAEAGSSIQERATGYMFCQELLPRDHEMHLMLVNTIRKDLDQNDISRIMIALNVLIQSPSVHVIPAVERRLYDLISHSSSLVRRRALLAARSLAMHEPDFLRLFVNRVRKRALDQDFATVNAALRVCEVIVKFKHGRMTAEDFGDLLNECFLAHWTSPQPESIESGYQLALLHSIVMHKRKLSKDGVRAIFEMIRYASGKKRRYSALLLECFNVLSVIPPENLPSAKDIGGRKSPIHAIRSLLHSGAPNDHYVFLKCLAYMPAHLWSGSDPDLPLVLEGHEVGRMMSLLESKDDLIRRITLSILWSVDHGIISGYRDRLLQSQPAFTDGQNWHIFVERLLEVAATSCSGNALTYIHEVADSLDRLDRMSGKEPVPVHERAVERVLAHIRNESAEFCSVALGSLLDLCKQDGRTLSTSMVVVLAVLVCGQASRLPSLPEAVLRILSTQLSNSPPPIQDALLLSMLRLSVECDNIPEDVTIIVRNVSASAGRHIQRRCTQFLTYSRQRTTIKQILAGMFVIELPEFLNRLQAFESSSPRSGRSSLPNSPSRTALGLAPASPRSGSSQLRYAAYASPLSPKMRPSEISRPSGAQEVHASPRQDQRAAALALETGVATSALSGELLEMHTFGEPPKENLISLDSPFIADPNPIGAAATAIESSTDNASDFRATWSRLTSFTSRGWCDLTLDAVVRRLQSLRLQLIVLSADQEPFQGNLKLIIIQPSADSDADSVDSAPEDTAAVAALRLEEGAEESCLWQMRCDDEALAKRIKHIISADDQ